MKKLTLIALLLGLTITAFSQNYKVGDVIRNNNTVYGVVFRIDSSVVNQVTYIVACGKIMNNIDRWGWDAAKLYSDTMIYAGFTDWQLPDMVQLGTFKNVWRQNYSMWYNYGVVYAQSNGMPTWTSVECTEYLGSYAIGIYSGVKGCFDKSLKCNIIPVRKVVIKTTPLKRTVSIRCSAMTKLKIQCKNKTFSPNGLCKVHGGN